MASGNGNRLYNELALTNGGSRLARSLPPERFPPRALRFDPPPLPVAMAPVKPREEKGQGDDGREKLHTIR